MKQLYTLLTIYLLFLLFNNTTAYANTVEFDAMTDVPADKVWSITFSSFVSEDTLKDAITVTDEDGNTYEPQIEVDENQTVVRVLPPEGGYTPGVGYTLSVNSSATSIFNKQLEAPVEKSFIIEEEEHFTVTLNENVEAVTDITLAPGSKYIMYGEEGQEAETFILPNNSYEVGDIIQMDPNDEFTAGFIRKIVSIEEIDGKLNAKTIFPTLDEAFADLDINTSFELNQDNMVDMELEDRVVIQSEGNVSDGWEFALLDYLTTIEGQVYGVTGSVNMDNVRLKVDFNKEKILEGAHSAELTGTMVTSIEIAPQKNIRLSKNGYIPLVQSDVKLGKFTYVLPYGFTVQFNAGFVIKPSVILGARLAYTNTTDFTLGAMYQNEKFSPIAKFDTRNDTAASISGGVKVKVGPRLTLEGGYATIAILNLHQDFGAYGKYENHLALEDNFGSCTTKEIGAFYDMTFEIPELKRFTPFYKYSPVAKEVPLIEKNGCELITGFEFSEDEVSLDTRELYQAEVYLYSKDIVTAETGKQELTSKKDKGELEGELTFTTNDKRIIVSQGGQIYPKASEEDYEAIVTATYNIDGETYSSTLKVTVNALPSFVNIEVSPEEMELEPGQKDRIIVTGTHRDGSTKSILDNVTFTSSNPDIVRVDKEGIIYVEKDAKADSIVNVTVTYNAGKSNEIKKVVKVRVLPLTEEEQPEPVEEEVKTIAEQFPDPNLAQAIAGYMGPRKTVNDTITKSEINQMLYLNSFELKFNYGGISSMNGFEIFNGTNLERLYVSRNPLTTLDVSGLTNLQFLEVSGNQLTTLDVSGLTNLQDLAAINNQLTTLDVSGLTNLQNLDVAGNQLTTLDVSGLTNLEVLKIGDNPLTTLDVSGLTNLRVLITGLTRSQITGEETLPNLAGY